MKTIATLIILALTLGAWAADNAAVAPQQATSLKPQAASFGTDAITIPQMLSYQGKLTDTFGLPAADTIYAVRFRLYAQPSGGTQFWEENQNVRTTGGLFSVLLGSTTPIGTVPDAGAAYLGMAVAGGAEMTPRLRIASAAYAYLTARAANADLLQGRDTTTFSRNTHLHDATYVNEAQADAVTSAMIVNGTVAAVDLGQMGASSGQVMKWTGSAWAPRNDSVGAGGMADNAWVRGTPDSVLYTVHRLGVARGEASNMLYGSFRQSHVNFGVSCTTGTSGLDNANIVVAGGFGNRARAALASVGGGTLNVAGGLGAAVAGGAGNTAGDVATDTAAIVAGGYGNLATAAYSTVGGGKNDTASADYTTVSGGRDNTASGPGAAVGGGALNTANGANSTIAGGGDNTAGSDYAVVGGGQSNNASGGGACVGGGQSNTAPGLYAAVGGGQSNDASGMFSVVPGGRYNRARGYLSFAAGARAHSNHSGCFVWGDSTQTASDSVYTTGANQWRVRARGGAWFYSNLAMTTGAYLAPGSNAWVSACDSATKEDFRPVDRKAVLDKVASLRVRDYKMKDQDDGTRHIGPVAQDFHAAFGYGETETGINTADADGVLLAAVQALYEQNQVQQAEIEQLKAELKRR